MEKKIIKFIKANKLNFNDIGSGLNGACVILAGYISYLEESGKYKVNLSFFEIEEAVIEAGITHVEFIEEFERVYNFASSNNYGDFWTTSDAKKMYKF